MMVMISSKKYLVLFLICSLLISCSASRHAGITYVNRPLLSEQDENKWFIFYQDKFDANKGDVLPPTEQYPKSAHDGYKRAKVDWDVKVQKANTSTIIFVTVAATFLVIVAALTIKDSMSKAEFNIK
jgi:hypothetical protein